ncbi:MAG: hypothetical protein GY696_13985 [Gammaproteobacteria bacterium]|nr:hypothetical protein [Gammaproteobacteria bacterium]
MTTIDKATPATNQRMRAEGISQAQHYDSDDVSELTNGVRLPFAEGQTTGGSFREGFQK